MVNGFVADDFYQIINNTLVHSLSNTMQFFTGSTYESGGADRLVGIFYRPIMLFFYALIYALFGLHPTPYHIFQLFVHIVNAVLLFLFFRKFFPRTVSFVASLMFLIHPINNEAVVFIANFQEVLFFFFGMNALLFVTQKKTTPRTYLLISILLLLSVLSKETGILFFFIVLFLHYVYYKRRGKTFLFFTFAAFAFYVFLRYGVGKMFLAQTAVAPITNAPFIIKALNVPYIIFTYLTTFFFPKDLVTNNFWIVRGITVQDFVIPLVVDLMVLLLMVFLGFLTYKKKKHFLVFLLFFIWFAIGIGVHIHIIPLDATLADRWFYFPIVGLIGLGATAYMQWATNITKKLTIGVCIVILILIGIRTFVRTPNWKDGLTLTSHDIKVARKNFLLDNAHGTELILVGRYKEAKPYVVSSVNEYPYYANLNNLGIIYTAEKNKKMAKKYLLQAVTQSQNYRVYENYAKFLLVYDNEKEARGFAQKALTVLPKNPILWRVLAQSSYLLKDYKRAKDAAKMAYLISPTEENKKLFDLLNENKPISVTQRKLK